MSGNYFYDLLNLDTDLDTKCNQLLDDLRTYKEELVLSILDTNLIGLGFDETELRVLTTIVDYYSVEIYNLERLCTIDVKDNEEIFMSHRRDPIARLKTFLFAPGVFRIKNVYFDVQSFERY